MLTGNSLADKVMDLQRVESVIARQMQDAMYLGNMPRPLVDMGSEYAATTLEDVLRPIAGSPIRYKGQKPEPFQAGLDVSKSLTVLEHWQAVREQRTGITRLNMGLDADTLNKTATGAAMQQAAGQQMEESIARNFAEAFGRLMAKKYRLMRAEGAQFPIKVDGQYRTANASNWPDEFRMIIRVGLGTGRKEQKLQYLFALSGLMAQAVEIGAVDKRGIFRLGSEIVNAMQLGQGDDYFVDPDQQPDQPQTDPEAAKAQAEVQKEQIKAQAKAQGDQMAAQSKAEGSAQQAQVDLLKAQAEAELERERMAQEAQLERERMAQEHDLSLIGMATDAHVKTQMAKNRPGGKLDK